MKVVEVSAVAIIATLICLMLKEKFPQMSMAVSLTASTLILILLFNQAEPIFYKIKEISSLGNIDDKNLEIIFKALGICFLTQFSCDACADAGQKAIASKLELFGKTAVLVVTFPLIIQILNIVTSLIGG